MQCKTDGRRGSLNIFFFDNRMPHLSSSDRKVTSVAASQKLNSNTSSAI